VRHLVTEGVAFVAWPGLIAVTYNGATMFTDSGQSGPGLAQQVGGFIVGALYRRGPDIHDRFGGNRQSGISVPAAGGYIFLFTGRSGRRHGYNDSWTDDGILHYFGEGQTGNMTLTRGNLAIDRHIQDGRRLLVFRTVEKGIQRFEGEFVARGYDTVAGLPDRDGNLRTAIVFRLEPVHDAVGEAVLPGILASLPTDPVAGPTVRQALTEVRTKQNLFRRRLQTVEAGCRLTGVKDLRFLRASHMKPWADSSDQERVDANNGLLLTPSADLLFDRGWISFRDEGTLLVSPGLSEEVRERIGLNLSDGRKCGTFTGGQADFLEYHRDCIFGDRTRQESLPAQLFTD